MSSDRLIGFEPRSGLIPLWLHTLELDRDGNLAGIIVVVDVAITDSLAGLMNIEPAELEHQLVHAAGAERWLRLDRRQAIDLHRALDRSRPGDPHHLPGVHSTLVEVVNILDGED